MAIVPQSPTLLDGTVRENREKSFPVAGFCICLEWTARFTVALCAELLTVIRVRVWNHATDDAVVGGNRNANDSDEHLLQTLRTCRLDILVERGLDAAIGQVRIRDAVLFGGGSIEIIGSHFRVLLCFAVERWPAAVVLCGEGATSPPKNPRTG